MDANLDDGRFGAHLRKIANKPSIAPGETFIVGRGIHSLVLGNVKTCREEAGTL